jgi:hypothetical protein
MEIEIREKDWIVMAFSNGGFQVRWPKSSSWERMDPENGLLFGLSKIALIYDHAKLQHDVEGILFSNIPDVPLSLFAICREFFLNRAIPMMGYDYGTAQLIPHTVVDLSKTNICVVQRKFSDGPLRGEPVQKYGWFDEKYLYVFEMANGFALYTKRTVSNEADIYFLGMTETKPAGYFVANFDQNDRHKEQEKLFEVAESFLNRLPGDRVGLLDIQWFRNVKLAVQSKPGKVWEELANWIGRHEKLQNEGGTRLRSFEFQNYYMVKNQDS